MISITSMAINAIISFILYILKAVFSMLSWFIKKIAWLFKLLFCALPLTTVLFILLIIANIFLLIVGIPQNDLLDNYEDVLYTDIQISQKLFDDLKIWWTLNVFNYRGNIAFVPLLILSAVMAIPVFTVFLSMSVVLSFGRLLFYGVMIDICIYLIRAIFHKSFVAQFLDRYYLLFPDKGKKHYEKSYEKWLRKHHEEFEDDYEYSEKHSHRHKEYFYEDIDEDYSEEFYETGTMKKKRIIMRMIQKSMKIMNQITKMIILKITKMIENLRVSRTNHSLPPSPSSPAVIPAKVLTASINLL